MRLIDADAYIKYCDDHWIPLNVDAVNVQPTVDAVPREELLNTLNGRLDFLQKWRNETADFKYIATAMIEDCEDIIDIVRGEKEEEDEQTL